MYRVLILEESEVLAQILTKNCFAENTVRWCADGNSALDVLQQFRPELLIINMSLPYKDGLTVLREATYLPQKILAFSYVTDPYAARTLGMLGVQYILHMPTAGSVLQALRVMEEQQTGIRADLRSLVVEILYRLGIPTNLDGYKLLVLGLPLFFQDPTQLLGKELYPAIVCASGHGTASTVERSIRQAIQSAWKTRNDSQWELYFTRNAKGQISCPTVKKFLSVLVRYLQKELAVQE